MTLSRDIESDVAVLAGAYVEHEKSHVLSAGTVGRLRQWGAGAQGIRAG